tara:strand:+ start:423 stop:563 length:141 start_codon:yes stop_codon:yes gene_type:complete
MPLYYILSINVPFGFVAMIIGLAVRFGKNGSLCALGNEGIVQMERE